MADVPCLHCAILDVIREHIRLHGVADKNGQRTMSAAELVEVLATVTGSVIEEVPEDGRPPLAFDHAETVLELVGLTGALLIDGWDSDGEQPTGHLSIDAASLDDTVDPTRLH